MCVCMYTCMHACMYVYMNAGMYTYVLVFGCNKSNILLFMTTHPFLADLCVVVAWDVVFLWCSLGTQLTGAGDRD